MADVIDDFITSWNTKIAMLRSVDMVLESEIFNDKQIYYHSNSNSDQRLLFDVMPEPYLGNPRECSYVIMNLNPGQYIEELQNAHNGRFQKIGNAIDEYSKFAVNFPYLIDKYCTESDGAIYKGNQWWKKRDEYFKRILRTNGSSSENLKKPFSLEICPWRSRSIGDIRLLSTENGILYLNTIFDIASLAANSAVTKIVFTIGKYYYSIFKNMKINGEVRFHELATIDNKNSKNSIVFPKNKSGDYIKRTISIWNDVHNNIRYFNTFAQGSNTIPSNKFDNIIRNLLIM